MESAYRMETTSTNYTCNTCGLAFPSADLQRQHMKTEWHRYNLKRRVAQLPPITAEAFAEKVRSQADIARSAAATGNTRRQITKKDLKREEKKQKAEAKKQSDVSLPLDAEKPLTGSSEGLILGKPIDEDHQETSDDETIETTSVRSSSRAPSSIGDREEWDSQSVAEDAEYKSRLAKQVEIPPNVCFVDGHVSETVEDNVEYMKKKYGLFMPEKEYLVDLEGLMTYLGEKVGLGNICVKCGFQGRSLESVRAHMISKSHVKIPFESEDEKLEISQFYDFRSSYATKPRRVVDSASLEAVSDDGDEWEDEGEVVGSDEEDLDELDDELQAMYITETGGELQIAPGVRVGHRSLQRYYRQTARPAPVLSDGQGTVLAVDSRAGVQARDPVQSKANKLAWNDQKKAQNVYLRRDKFVNNQPHFRDQLLQ